MAAATGDPAGVPVIAGWAQRLGLDISAELEMARIMHRADPAALQAAADQHAAVGQGLADTRLRLHTVSADARANWQGETATAVGAHLSAMGDGLSTVQDGNAEAARQLRTAADTAQRAYRATTALTAAAAAALHVLAAPAP